MAERVRWKVISDEGKQNWQNYYERVRNQITLGPSVPASVFNQIIEEITARAPDPETETNLIMYGTGGPPGKVTTSKKGKVRNFYVDGRIRFMKTDGQLFIKEAIDYPGVNNISYSKGAGSFIGYEIGNFALLNELTKFTWVNATKGGKKTAPTTYPHVSDYGTFAAFEYGTLAIGWGEVNPRFGKSLVPTDQLRMQDMYKNISPYQMYSHVTKDYIRTLIQEKIREVKYQT